MPGWGQRNEQGERFVIIPGFFLSSRGEVVTLGFCSPRLKGRLRVWVCLYTVLWPCRSRFELRMCVCICVQKDVLYELGRTRRNATASNACADKGRH